MRRSSDKLLQIILALFLAIAPLQSAMAGFDSMSDNSPTPPMMLDMDSADHGCNTNDCCSTNECTSSSCSFCYAAPALIPAFSIALSSADVGHERFSDTNILHWITTPPLRPPWS